MANQSYLDAVLCPLVAECSRHLHDTTLCGSIGRYVDHRDKRSKRSNVDDLTRTTELDQLHPELLSSNIRALQIYREDLEGKDQRVMV